MKFFHFPNIRQDIFPKSSCKKWEVNLQPHTKLNMCCTGMWVTVEACVWPACCMTNGKIWELHTQYTSANDQYNFEYHHHHHHHHPSSIMHQIQGLQSEARFTSLLKCTNTNHIPLWTPLPSGNSIPPLHWCFLTAPVCNLSDLTHSIIHGWSVTTV